MGTMEEIEKLNIEYVEIIEHARKEIKILKSENERLKKDNITDSLTKANNRNFYDNNLAGIVNDYFENNKKIGFLMIDLNDFKWINDNYKSHTVGDMVLRDFIHQVSAVVASIDYVIRMGGDETLVVLPNADENTGESLENRIQTKVDLYNNEEIKKRLNEGERVNGKESEEGPYKLSFASAYILCKPSEKLSLREIYKKVDRKMYEEKERIKKQISLKG